MKIYYSNLASVKSNLFPPIGVLISYYGLKKIKKPPYCNKLFLDSGAFSAWRQNVNIDLKRYIKFILKNIKKIDVYCSLDHILSYKKSVEDYKEMKKQGLNPLPCFHFGEPYSVLENYLKQTSYVALGGIAKRNKKERSLWLDTIFNKYPGQYHGFGIQDRDILKRYPWHSIDSSSAHVMARFGGICTPWGDIKINPKVNEKDLSWKSPRSETTIQEWVLSLGIDYDRAKENSAEGIELRCLINILYYESLKKQHIEKGRFSGFQING